MYKQGCCILILMSFMLSACLSSVWTGANVIYSRHSLYKKLTDYELSFNAQQLLFKDRVLKQPGCALDLAVFNRDVLLVGHVPTLELRDLAIQRINRLEGYRRIFKQIAVSRFSTENIEDTWITAKIKGKIIADASLDPTQFKILTADKIVYVMGDVLSEQADKVLFQASETEGVKRVVRLLKIYTLSEKSS